MASGRRRSSRAKSDTKGNSFTQDYALRATVRLTPLSAAAPPPTVDAIPGISKSPTKRPTIRVSLPREQKKACCPMCGHAFRSTGKLHDHLISDHVEVDVEYHCAKCGKKYAKVHALECHVPKCTPKERGSFVCDICSKDFATFTGLSQHNRHRHPEKAKAWRAFTETISKKAIATILAREKPRQDGSYFCESCQSSWPNRRSYSAHRRHKHKTN